MLMWRPGMERHRSGAPFVGNEVSPRTTATAFASFNTFQEASVFTGSRTQKTSGRKALRPQSGLPELRT